MGDDPVATGGGRILSGAIVVALAGLLGLIAFAPRAVDDVAAASAPVQAPPEIRPESAPATWDPDRWPLKIEGYERPGGTDRNGEEWSPWADQGRPPREDDPGL